MIGLNTCKESYNCTMCCFCVQYVALLQYLLQLSRKNVYSLANLLSQKCDACLGKVRQDNILFANMAAIRICGNLTAQIYAFDQAMNYYKIV